MILKKKVVFSILIVFFLFSGCTSITPRYKLANKIPEVDELNSALLQIPKEIGFYAFDGHKTTFSVRTPFASQLNLPHAYRETLIPAGMHSVLYSDLRKFAERQGSLKYISSQKGLFMTAIEFQKGHTYRFNSIARKENGKIVFYGFVEELPFLMKRRSIKAGPIGHQFDYWYNQDWRVAGIALDTEKLLKIDPEQRLGILMIESSRRIDDLKTKFPQLK